LGEVKKLEEQTKVALQAHEKVKKEVADKKAAEVVSDTTSN